MMTTNKLIKFIQENGLRYVEDGCYYVIEPNTPILKGKYGRYVEGKRYVDKIKCFDVSIDLNPLKDQINIAWVRIDEDLRDGIKKM